MLNHLQKYLHFAQKADYALGLFLIVAAGYMAYQRDWLYCGLSLFFALTSFLSAKYQPAKWVARKMLIARLKH